MIKNIIVYKINNIIMNEIKKGYYSNAANIKKVIDIEKTPIDDKYLHVENLIIWQNGFYNFQKFNITTPGIKNDISLTKKMKVRGR